MLLRAAAYDEQHYFHGDEDAVYENGDPNRLLEADVAQACSAEGFAVTTFSALSIRSLWNEILLWTNTDLPKPQAIPTILIIDATDPSASNGTVL